VPDHDDHDEGSRERKELQEPNPYVIDLAVRLFKEEAITQGDGALIARVSRSEFIDILLERGISPIQIDPNEVTERSREEGPK